MLQACLSVPPAPRFMTDDERWQAVVIRDRWADGSFFYAVATTGVYCRPSCGARAPRRENVSFHATANAARAAGYRACKRCRPDGGGVAEAHAAAILRACRIIETAETIPALSELAEAAGFSPFHFHRVFKSVTGVTPRAYAAAHRAGRVREALGRADTVTAAIYDSGYNSSGRFYAASAGMLGMTPSRFRDGGAGEAIRFALGQCSLGGILVAATEKGIVAITLGDDPEALLQDLQRRFPSAALVGGDAEFERMVATVVGFVEAPEAGLDLPLDIRGAAFQQRVWQALRAIPAGATTSYSEIARRIGAPNAARAVAKACADNALAVAIPCHRVVRSDGALSGYRWGIDRKRALLDREAGAARRAPA
jgi:AraC family transcriptional regulator of adaptative response/methylated-DNA-[protein]-cysteine methyltransferase